MTTITVRRAWRQDPPTMIRPLEETDSTRGAREGWTRSSAFGSIRRQQLQIDKQRRKEDGRSNESGHRARRSLLVITRVFDAPRDLVFKAWNEPEHMARWSGPRGFTSTVLKHDPRPAAVIESTCSAPTRSWSQGVYREVVPPARLVMVFGWADANGNRTRPETTLTLLFDDVGGKTRLTLHQTVFESVTARDMHNEGWTSSLDCLAEYLATV